MKSVFISHSSKDKAIADVIVASLEQEGISVWIAPRDIPGGTDYGASIMKGLRECDVLVLVFSKASNESEAVIREVQLAFNEKKAIIPFRIEDTPVGDSLAFYLSGLHWIDAVQKKKRDLNVLQKDVKGVLQKLGREIKEKPPRPTNAYPPAPTLMPEPTPVPTPVPVPTHAPASSYAPTPSYTKPTSTIKAIMAATCALLLIVAGLLIFVNADRDAGLAADLSPETSLFYTPGQYGITTTDEPLQDEDLDYSYMHYESILTPTLEPIPTLEPAPTPTLEQANVSVGDLIRFSDLDWWVLDVEGNQALIITDRTIRRMYHHTKEAVTWETSEVRQWLNGQFLNRFTQQELSRIEKTTVLNHDNPWDFSGFGGYVSSPGGNNTTDRVFLLSIDEVLRYLGDSGMVARGATMGASERTFNASQISEWGICLFGIHDQYSEARIALDLYGRVSWWWLRSPGRGNTTAAFVWDNGFLDMFGDYVYVTGGIRPALWLYLD